MLLVPRTTTAAAWRMCFCQASGRLLFPLVLSLIPFLCCGSIACLAGSIISATSPTEELHALFPYVLLDHFFCFECFSFSVECVCRGCRIQYDDVASYCLLCIVHGNVAPLWRCFMHTHIVSLFSIEKSARKLVVPDING